MRWLFGVAGVLVLFSMGAPARGSAQVGPEAPAGAEQEPDEDIATGADETFPGGATETGAAPPEAPPEPVRELPPASVPGPVEAEPPILESWWFWVSIAAVALGITLAIVVDVTTDDPRPSVPEEPDGAAMGLRLRF